MKIILCHSNKEFIDTYFTYLKRYQIEMNLFTRNLNLAQGVTDINLRGGVYDDNNNLVLIFLNAVPFNLQLFSVKENLECFDELAKYFVQNSIYINGIQGNLFDCQQFINSYNLLTGKLFKYFHAMDIMKLDKLPEMNTLGQLSIATNDDYEFLLENMNLFMIEAVGETLPKEELIKKMALRISQNALFVYRNKDGIKTSIVADATFSEDGVTLSYVYTLKPYRNQGYAKEMIYLVCKYLLQTNKYITLFVDKTNPISNKVYADVGFKIIIDNYDCRLIH